MDSIKRFLITPTGTAIFFVLVILLLVMAVAFVTYFVFKNAKSATQKTTEQLTAWADKYDTEKEMTAACVAEEQGETNTHTFLGSIDVMLRQSGLKHKFRAASPLLFIIICIASGVAFALLSTILFNHLLAIALGTLFGVLLPYMALGFIAKKNNDRVQQMLLIFCDTAINFSATITSLMELLRKCGDYMDDPLKGALVDANSEALYGKGGQWLALYHLKQRVANTQFTAIIQDLELSSRYDANYQKVLKDRKTILESHIASEAKKRQMLSGSRVNIGIMIAVCVVCLNSMGDLVEGGVWALLLSDPAGMMMLLAAVLIIIYAVKVCFTTPTL